MTAHVQIGKDTQDHECYFKGCTINLGVLMRKKNVFFLRGFMFLTGKCVGIVYSIFGVHSVERRKKWKKQI